MLYKVKKILISVLATAFVNTGIVYADDHSSEAEIRGLLENEMQIMRALERGTVRLDLARLRLIETNVRLALSSLNEFGLAHANTNRMMQQVIITFRYSNAFFTQIQTVDSRQSIRSLLETNDQVTRKMGFDDTPYTQITAYVYTQMHKLFMQLKDNGVLTPVLRDKIENLIVPMGHLIAIAKQGDRPRTFDAAVPLQRQISELYPLMNAITQSDAAFDIILEIQGLNEFYAEFAQISAIKLEPKDCK